MDVPDLTGKKAIIMGTAPSWKLAPWNDPDAQIWGLNDAHLLGFPRWDRWYDLHPFEKFLYRPDNAHKLAAHTIPAGTFTGVRTLLLIRDTLQRHPFPANAASSIYRLDGLPAGQKVPARVRVRAAVPARAREEVAARPRDPASSRTWFRSGRARIPSA